MLPGHFNLHFIMMNLEIRRLPIDQLTPAPYNPRKVLKPTDKAYQKLAASLREFGLVEPLVWNEVTGRVVGGHARLRILREMGVQEVPVSVVRLSEAREKALNVLLNNQEAQARFDTSLLADVLEDLQRQDELQLSGFDEGTLDLLRFKPSEELPMEPVKPETVEVTIVTDAATFVRLSPRLNELVREFDLATHIRER